MFKYANGNSANSVDIGFYGEYITGGTTKYSGIYSDATTKTFNIFKDTTVEPGTTVDTTAYTKADFICADINITSLTTNSSSGSSGQILSNTGSGLHGLITIVYQMSSTVLGGIKVGNNLSIDGNGVLSSTNTTYAIGDGGLTENNFTNTLKSKLDSIDTNANNYSLPNASSTILGGIKVGNNLSIDGNGVLSSTNTTYTVGDGGLTQNNFTDELKQKLDELSSNSYNGVWTLFGQTQDMDRISVRIQSKYLNRNTTQSGANRYMGCVDHPNTTENFAFTTTENYAYTTTQEQANYNIDLDGSSSHLQFTRMNLYMI